MWVVFYGEVKVRTKPAIMGTREKYMVKGFTFRHVTKKTVISQVAFGELVFKVIHEGIVVCTQFECSIGDVR